MLVTRESEIESFCSHELPESRRNLRPLVGVGRERIAAAVDVELHELVRVGPSSELWVRLLLELDEVVLPEDACEIHRIHRLACCYADREAEGLSSTVGENGHAPDHVQRAVVVEQSDCTWGVLVPLGEERGDAFCTIGSHASDSRRGPDRSGHQRLSGRSRPFSELDACREKPALASPQLLVRV